jgi:hypothetical protein
MVSLWPLLYPHNAWVGTANPLCGTIKISKGKHIRDAGVLARGFAVTAFVSAQCVGREPLPPRASILAMDIKAAATAVGLSRAQSYCLHLYRFFQ